MTQNAKLSQGLLEDIRPDCGSLQHSDTARPLMIVSVTTGADGDEFHTSVVRRPQSSLRC